MFRKIIINLKFYYYVFIGRLFGISSIVRYLRNPDPLLSLRLLRAFGAKIGSKTTIKRSIYLDNVCEDQSSVGDFSHIQIGSNCYIGDSVYFDLVNKIIIEDNVVVSGQVSFVTHSDCNRSEYLTKKFPRKNEKICIGKGVWLGFGSTVLCGVSIGENSVISACSLIKNKADSSCVYSGVPAQKVKSLC